MTLSKTELARYSRHLLLPDIGVAGQQKLKKARVLLVGMGGLGSPVALYLAAAGVGRLGLVDDDVVDESNLQRQILYTAADVGKPKVTAAKAKLLALNPHIEIDEHSVRLSAANALEIFADYHIIVDGADNFPTRYLVNDACVLSGKPNVYGSIFKFEGQASVFATKNGPCYRCLYPEPPPPGLVPNCSESGVLGVLPGNVGVTQATEAMKLILGIGEPLIGRLLLYDALAMSYRELKLSRDPACRVCGDQPTVTELIDYEQFCGVKTAKPIALSANQEISVRELHAKVQQAQPPFILDVREPHELNIAQLPDCKLIPLGDLPERLAELDREIEIHILCRSGVRSAKALKILENVGFQKLRNIKGGILAWADEIDNSLTKY